EGGDAGGAGLSIYGNCFARVVVGTTPPMFCRMGSRSLAAPVYFSVPFRSTFTVLGLLEALGDDAAGYGALANARTTHGPANAPAGKCG
ncbi:MAG: hypothetical protein KDC03_16540, partial [Flavobacteriales bacterium]|nr:hypothetical protein [Flavobacteriales bacterium]